MSWTTTHADYDQANKLEIIFVLVLGSKVLYYGGGDKFLRSKRDLFWSVFNQCTACVDLRYEDMAEFLSTRIKQLEENSRVMYHRIIYQGRVD